MKNQRRDILWIILGTSLLVPAVGRAGQGASQQVPERQTVDGIAAIVGNEVILQSEVQLGVTVTLQQSGQDPSRITAEQMESLSSQILDRLIDEKLILAKARRDSVEVSRSDIEKAIDDQIATIKQNIGGEAQFRQALQSEGLTEAELRKRFFSQAETELLRDKLAQKYNLWRPGPVSRREAATFLRENAADLLAFQQILLNPPEGQDPGVLALQKTQDIRRRIVEGGEDFGALARQFSDDTGSGQQGGDLGEYDRGSFVPAFEDSVWSVPIGRVSQPIRTQFGWHILEVLSRTDTKVHVRHILITPGQGGSMAAALADTISAIRARYDAGTSFDDLVAAFSQAPGADERRGYLGLFVPPLSDPRTRAFNSAIPPAWAQPLQSLQPGGLSPGLEDSTGVHILRRMPLEGPAVDRVIQYDFPKVEQLVQSQRQNQEYEDWLQEIRDQTYIEIKKVQ